ncbi:MAG: hypothetical protein ABSA05_04465 [Opitutaceae bacterium]|jgi:hypothetical protein
MKRPNPAWDRLVAAARNAPDDRDVQAPFGFSTRVAALAMASGRPARSQIERYSIRAMILACTLAAAAIAANYSSIRDLFQDQTPPSDDPISELVDLAS